ncbi:MAG TPA: TolC family protein [Gemmatimonadales bacterium]|nr:TolC family protein [Gemmatimonadales bacterium]
MGIIGTLLILAAASVTSTVPERTPGTPVEASWGDTLVLTLPDVRKLAIAQNPDLRADRLAIPMAMGAVRQSRVEGLNPSLEVQRFESGIAGRNPEFGVALMTDLPWSGQRGLRTDAARVGVERSIAAIVDAERQVVTRASLAFVRALAANQRLLVADTMVTATRRLYDVTRIQLREGEISSLEANLAEIEFGRAEARLFGARRGALSAMTDLRLAIGVGLERPIRLVPIEGSLPDPNRLSQASLLAAALDHRPDLLAQRRAIEQVDLERRLASRQGIPTPQLSGLLSRDAGEQETRLGLGIRIPLPILDRNRGRVDAETARLEQAERRFDALALSAGLQVNEAFLAYTIASNESTVLEQFVLEPAHRNLELLEVAYQAGKVGLPTLLLLRNQLLDAELEYWDAWQARHDALLRLELAVGAPIDEANSTPHAAQENNR